MKKLYIPRPTKAIIKGYFKKWDRLENYVLQERSLNLLFRDAYPENKRIEHILIKVCCLNQFYSTNIYSPYTIAKHIFDLDIDRSLATGDDGVVNKIAKTKMPKEKIYNFYSFASKYCSHHRPELYPIYDSFVEKILMHFQRQENFYSFRKSDLRDYGKFREILEHFKEFFELQEYSLKEIDKYLWQVGKDYFSKYQPKEKN